MKRVFCSSVVAYQEQVELHCDLIFAWNLIELN